MVSRRHRGATQAGVAFVMLVVAALPRPAVAAPEDPEAAQRRANRAAEQLSQAEEEMARADDTVAHLETRVARVDARTVLVAHRLGGLDLLESATGRRLWQVDVDGVALRGGPVVGPDGTFAFPLDDATLLLAGPQREPELVPAPGRISGVATGPDGLLVAATRGAPVNAVAATPRW